MSVEMNYEDFCRGICTEPDGLRELGTILNQASSSMINLAPGIPDPDLFPYKKMEVTLSTGEVLTLDNNYLKRALQYAPTEGITPLRNLLTELQIQVHQPPQAKQDPRKFQVIITNGCTGAYQNCVDVLLNKGDAIVIERPCFSTMLTGLRNRAMDILEVETDEDGMIPSELRKCIEKSQNKPRVLYIVPSGGNPSTATLTLERKKEKSTETQQYNMLIIEDDPYYYLHYETDLIPSFLSMDTDGRVLRCDSFSKSWVPGFRLGMLSGPTALVQKVRNLMTVMSNSQVPFCQNLLYSTFEKVGISGFLEHTQKLCKHYTEKRNIMDSILTKYMTGVAEWSLPKSGVFFWIKLLHVKDSKALIFDHAIENDVLLVPGSYFMVDKSKPCPYVRACFCFSSAERMDEGIKRFANLVRANVESNGVNSTAHDPE